jgi:hypothetical protein
VEHRTRHDSASQVLNGRSLDFLKAGATANSDYGFRIYSYTVPATHETCGYAATAPRQFRRGRQVEKEKGDIKRDIYI